MLQNDALLAATFDVDRLALTGPPIRVVENLAVVSTRGAHGGIVAGGRARVCRGGTGNEPPGEGVSRQGLEQTVIDTPGNYENPRIAPDGRQIVVTTSGDLWIQDTTRATFTRLTSNETAGNWFPIWTLDGKRVIFRTLGLRWIDADGSGRSPAHPGYSVNDYPGSVSPDGASLAITRITPETSADVYTLALAGEPQAKAIVKGPA